MHNLKDFAFFQEYFCTFSVPLPKKKIRKRRNLLSFALRIKTEFSSFWMGLDADWFDLNAVHEKLHTLPFYQPPRNLCIKIRSCPSGSCRENYICIWKNTTVTSHGYSGQMPRTVASKYTWLTSRTAAGVSYSLWFLYF